jgi:ferredoxin
MKILYFTSTGNSLYVAKRIGGENYSIPKLLKEGRFDFENEKIGKRNGINFSYINEILMVDNYLPQFDMNKQVQSQAKKKIEDNLSIIVNDIHEGKEYIKRHSRITEILRSINLSFYDNNFERNFSVDSNCNSCKVCEKVCPVDNIFVNNRPVFLNNCLHCLACAHHCPQNAISIAKEKNKARFINQNIKLKEIIDSNN